MTPLDVIQIARAAGATLTVDGSSLLLESRTPPPRVVLDLLREHKREILEHLNAERRAVVRHVAQHFQSSPLGWCAHCGGKTSVAEPSVAIFCGADRADLHAECHADWLVEQENKACIALGIKPPPSCRGAVRQGGIMDTREQ